MSRAGTTIGTKRRALVEQGQLLQEARRQTPTLSKLPKHQQRRLIGEYHRRIVKGLPMVKPGG